MFHPDRRVLDTNGDARRTDGPDGVVTVGQRFTNIERRLDSHDRMLGKIAGGVLVIVAEIPVALFIADLLTRTRP